MTDYGCRVSRVRRIGPMDRDWSERPPSAIYFADYAASVGLSDRLLPTPVVCALYTMSALEVESVPIFVDARREVQLHARYEPEDETGAAYLRQRSTIAGLLGWASPFARRCVCWPGTMSVLTPSGKWNLS